MTSQIWPPVVDPSTLTRQVWDAQTALGIPGLARALQLYGGLLSQCALDLYRGDMILPRTPMLDLPDPMLRSLALFIRVHVADYLVHGNALHLITARNADRWPAGVTWFPAEMWAIDMSRPDRITGPKRYLLNGEEVPTENVVHVQRGAAPGFPERGMGVVEQHLNTLNRAGLQEAAEAQNLAHGGVPSAAVIAPQRHLSQGELDDAGEQWEIKFQGPGRRPGIFPYGTQVIPLSFSPQAQEASLARQMTNQDLANLLNLDPYWLGNPGGSHQYKSPGPMFLVLQRTSLEPVMTDLESVWGLSWTPYGQRVRFDRNKLTRDDFGTTITTLLAAVSGGLMSIEEARVYLGWTPEPLIGTLKDTTPEPAPALEAGPQPLQLVPGDQTEEDQTA